MKNVRLTTFDFQPFLFCSSFVQNRNPMNHNIDACVGGYQYAKLKKKENSNVNQRIDNEIERERKKALIYPHFFLHSFLLPED